MKSDKLVRWQSGMWPAKIALLVQRPAMVAARRRPLGARSNAGGMVGGQAVQVTGR